MFKTKPITKDYKPTIGDFVIDPNDQALGIIFKYRDTQTSWEVYWTNVSGNADLETVESVYTLESFLLVEA